ncbi:hypothetical protein RKD27_004154 [Streptomyces sp. SAI-126]|uniref:SCO3374 family protein n=1 Tax=unclassified Streptomyces TaxID=2593676 RepID=UPI001BAF4949|nr:hypothetical protein [Streptomyces sp. SAI-119]MDH6497497.1 hypothetical protein [Streptomyces sp. SAI-149]QUC55796.1 hypothetical protein IOD14_02785 [Streptomyces sp. A2-16]
MVGSHPPLATDLTAVPLPRRPLDAAADGDRVRRWYENELGWPTVPASAPESPVRLRLGLRFDVLDVPAEAGRAALRHLARTSPVAVRGDRMRFLVAAGSAEELPGLLDWLEWGTLALDLRAIGTGGVMRAPQLPEPGAGAGGLGEVPSVGTGRPETDRGGPGKVPSVSPEHPETGMGGLGEVPAARTGRPETDRGGPGKVPSVPPGRPETGIGGPGEVPAARTGRPENDRGGPGKVPSLPTGCPETGEGESPALPSLPGPGGLMPRTSAGEDRAAGSRRPVVLGRPGTLQGAAVWLRPPEPGCEVEASLPTMSALGAGGGAPDLVRVVNTVATCCHRLRLRRARP